MDRSILNASAVLALLRREPGAAAVAAALDGALMSTVNYAEVVSFFARRSGSQPDIAETLRPLALRLVEPAAATATTAGMLHGLTAAAGLSLGDRFCVALGKERGLPAMTADKAWTTIAEAAGVEVRLIR